MIRGIWGVEGAAVAVRVANYRPRAVRHWSIKSALARRRSSPAGFWYAPTAR